MARRRMQGPTLADMMRARQEGGYAASTPGAPQEAPALSDEEIAQMQAHLDATGKPPQPEPVALAVGQSPSPQQREALWGRGAPVGQTVSPNVFASPQANPGAAAAQQITAPAMSAGQVPPAAAPSQEDVLAGLAQKANEADPSSKTYMRLPLDVVQKYGLDGVDLANLSIGEKVALRRMGVTFPAPRAAQPARRGAPMVSPEDQRFNHLKAMYQGGGHASPFLQDGVVQNFRDAWGLRPLLRDEGGTGRLSNEPYDPNGDLIIGNPHR